MIGGGYISLEMAQFYRRMGSEVTVIEQSGQIAGHEDRDVADALQKLLEAEGINFRLNTHINSVMKNASGIEVVVKVSDREESLMATDLFVAIGRLPNTDDLGLETVEVKVSERGIIEVDKRLATNVPGIWAAGDVRGGPMFTHTSWDDYRILLSQMAGDGSRTTDRIVPYAVFTDPELGRVGMTEAEARKAGYSIKVSHFEMRRNGKAIEIGEPSGFIKVIIDAGNGQILGAAVLANKGAELVHMYIDVMNANVPYTVIRDAIHIHPTLAEAVQSAVSEFKETGEVTAS
jgi:pyruvate/2-oxoglutarate dehydrogenase complex dihydrolipoamide dehydrogenase (E3) component